MEAVVIYCKRCDHRLGTTLNSWTQIGKSFISPVLRARDPWGIALDGVIRHGESGTIIDNCRVQEVSCNQCRSTLGSKCLSTAVNHVLSEGQLLLRTASITVRNSSNHVAIEPTIQRILDLKNHDTHKSHPEGDNSSEYYDEHGRGRAANREPELDHILKNIEAQREKIQRIETGGYQLTALIDQTVLRINDEVGTLRNVISYFIRGSLDIQTKTRTLTDDILSAKGKISEIMGALRLLATQRQLKQEAESIRAVIADTNTSLRTEMSGMQQSHEERLDALESELKTAQQDLKASQNLLESARTTAKATAAASNTNTKDIIAMRAEVQQLRQELSLERSCKSYSTNSTFASRDLDILTENIMMIGQRANQVESLRMEFELLKGRVQRMETQMVASQRDPVADFQQRGFQMPQLTHSDRKMLFDQYAQGHNRPDIPSFTVTKEGGGQVDLPSSTTAHLTALPSSSPSTKAPKGSKSTDTPKLTKSGAIDKRTLKKRASEPKLAT
ncbi:hypothetical protein F4777DRAFT_587754 [Nemania sp. FL0916]|nr:hypothetical protein F4777DRAFT_587754 [Nemania sp. FL0916]